MEPIDKIPRKLIALNAVPMLLTFKRQLLGSPFDEQIITKYPRYIFYGRNKERIKISNDILYRQYHNDVGDISQLKFLLPVQLKDTVLNFLHGDGRKHHAISEMVQNKRLDNSQITPKFTIIPEWDLGPEDVMQIDLLPELPPSGGYENITTAIEVFSRNFFAYAVTSLTAVKTAKVIIDILTRRAYLPTVMITNKSSVFVPNVKHAIADVLGITLRHATMKLAKTIGVLQRTHATVKTSLKMFPEEFRNGANKYL